MTDYTIEELETDDIKDLILKRVLDDLYNDDFFNSHLEADAYYYTIFEKYDILVNKLKKNKELEEKQLKTLEEKEEKELEEKSKRHREDINEILKGLCIGLLIIFFPFIFIAFVIYQVLKEMK